MIKLTMRYLLVSGLLIGCSTTEKEKAMTEETILHHTINYIEFSVTDMEATKKFYSKAFEWEFTDYAPNYVGIKKPDGGEMGGFLLSETVKAEGPLVVLYSNNLEESFKISVLP